VWPDAWSLRASHCEPVAESRLGLRLRQYVYAGWKDSADVKPDRLVHSGMPGDPSPAQAEQPERDRGISRRHDRARNPGAYPFGQRPGVHGEGSAEVAS